MADYHLHEEFPSGMVNDYFNPDTQNPSNWNSLPGTIGQAYIPAGNPGWADAIGVSNPGTSAGDQAVCSSIVCDPQWANPGVGPRTLVQHIPQVGSPAAR